jgi:hypothetical protein
MCTARSGGYIGVSGNGCLYHGASKLLPDDDEELKQSKV